MADIQIVSPMPARADAFVDAATPVPVTGESGFDVWSAGAMVSAAPTAAVPAPPQDPLAAWLQQQMGFSGEFSAPPGTDPAIEALAAGLPPLRRWPPRGAGRLRAPRACVRADRARPRPDPKSRAPRPIANLPVFRWGARTDRPSERSRRRGFRRHSIASVRDDGIWQRLPIPFPGGRR